jgi:hypothetical protein
LSFRKANFHTPFDVSLTAACEDKWMRDNLGNSSVEGLFIPVHEVFERDEGAATEAELQALGETKLAQLYSAHEQLLGPLSEEDRRCCRALAGLEPLPAKASMALLETYVVRLVAGNAEKKRYDPTELQDFLMSRKAQLELQKLRASTRTLKHELKRLQRTCGDYEKQLEALQARVKDIAGSKRSSFWGALSGKKDWRG